MLLCPALLYSASMHSALPRSAGLTLRHGRGHVFRALLESICFGTEHIFETMRENGFTPTSVTVAGGATRSELWLQTHADVSNVPFVLTKVGRLREGGTGGLCRSASGGWRDGPGSTQRQTSLGPRNPPLAASAEVLLS